MKTRHYLDDVILEFKKLKRLSDRAVAQISDADLFKTLGEQSNSVAIIQKHMAGNMRSRWTDFLTTDGEKPDRHRDREFERLDSDTRPALNDTWESGWSCLFAALDPLGPEDLERTVYIREEPHTVLQAINRQLTHYAYHTGQIVQLARHWAGQDWESLSIPRGQSQSFNAKMRKRGSQDGAGGS